MLTPDLEARRMALSAEIDRRGTLKALAGAIGFSESRISRALNPAFTSDRRLAPIERAIADLSKSPRGERKNDSDADEPDPAEMARYDGLSDRELKRRGLVRLPLIEVAAGRTAADAQLNRIGEAEILPVTFVREAYGVDPASICVLKVWGTSMYGPTAWISPGSYVRARLLERGAQLRDGAVYAVIGPSGYLLKRLFIEETPAKDNRTLVRAIRLSSDNPKGGTSRIPMAVWEKDYWAFAMALRVEQEL